MGCDGRHERVGLQRHRPRAVRKSDHSKFIYKDVKLKGKDKTKALILLLQSDNARPLYIIPYREFFIDNLLVRIHFIIVMIRWTVLAPWEFEFSFPCILTSTFLASLHISFRTGTQTKIFQDEQKDRDLNGEKDRDISGRAKT